MRSFACFLTPACVSNNGSGSEPRPVPTRCESRLCERQCQADLPMRVSLVPQTGHVPCVACRPFASVTCFGSLISRDSRHLTQYAVAAIAWSHLKLRDSCVTR